jgi:transglutaminase-like putative cysteine protease
MREIIQIYLISFFQFMAGAILSIEISYGLVLIIYVFAALWALIIYNLKKESDDAGVKPDQKVVTKSFMGSSAALAIFIIFISILLFLMLPRLRTEFFSSSFINPRVLKTGFSDTVKLGKVGEIKKDHSAVMRVRILNKRGKINDNLYWRGIALDHFDGVTWSVDSEKYGDYEKKYKTNRYGLISIKEDIKNVIAHEVITEPIDTDILFAINMPVGYSGFSGGYRRYSGSILEVNNSYFLPFNPRQRIKYKAYSEISSYPDGMLNSESDRYSYYIKDRYLQLPEISDEIRELSNEITQNDSTAYEKAKTIVRYLLEEMNYTLTLDSGTKEFPLETFLLEKKEGHCEYFATAMVVFLRLNGIPSRIVNGFIGGSWNEHGNFYLIRESDAHSWVEVFFPKQGWVTFDPTPSSNNYQDSGGIYSVMSYIDYLKYRWQRYVIDFSRTDQIRLFASARQKISWNKNKAFNNFNLRNKGSKNLIIFIAVVSILGFILYNSERFHRGKNFSKNKQNSVTKIYNSCIKLLSKRGFDKKDYQTAKEFSEYVVSKGGSRYKIFEDFTNKYSIMRFQNQYANSDISNLKSLLNKIKKVK